MINKEETNQAILNRYQNIKIPINELAKKVKYPDLMKNQKGEVQAVKNLGTIYRSEIEKCADAIKYAFDNLEGASITHSYKGKPVRIKLDDISIVKDLCDFFTSLTGDRLTEITVTRNCSTDLTQPSCPEEFIKSSHWLSELWHLDNFREGHYKIGIYLNDVLTPDNAPFEFYGDPNKDFYGDLIDTDLSSRLYGFNPKETFKVLAPKYTTLIFSPSFVHKGNYARNGGYRDFIMLGFNQF